LIDNAGNTADTRPRLRVVNASPGAGSLDVRADGPASLTLVSGLAYGGVSGYSTLTDGTYTVSVYPHGGSTPLAAIPGVTLEVQSAYTLVLGGVLPSVVSPNAPNPVQGFQGVKLTDQTSGRLTALAKGCNQVLFNVPVGTPMTSLLARVTDPTLVISIWRFDSALGTLRGGYFKDPVTPIDVAATVGSPELGYICVTDNTSWSPP
jgi:hypothetical protein